MGKGGEKQVGEKKELLIDGYFYDVTDFRHPGGSVIDFYAGKGIDATQSFHQFHIRSKKVEKFMNGMTKRRAEKAEIQEHRYDLKQEQLMADFDKFTAQLEKEGFFKPSIPHVVYRTLEIVLLYGFGFYLIKNAAGNIPVFALGIILAAIAQGRCGWYMHEGGHYSLTGIQSIDIWLQIIFYGVGCGMSGGWWRIQHNKHHSMPQKLGYDVDLNTLPLVAFSAKVCKKLPFVHKLWIRSQAILFPTVITSLVALGWQFYLHPRFVIRKKDWREGACMILRYVLWHNLITTQFGLKQSILIYLAYDWIAANYIFIDFAVSHTHLPTVPKEDTKVDWIRYASDYTMNIKPGPFSFVNWWMGYLNFQIEHHLFPCMPQFRHSIISPRVKKFFEEHGLKYDQRGYWEAMDCTFKNLDKVGVDVFLG